VRIVNIFVCRWAAIPLTEPPTVRVHFTLRRKILGLRSATGDIIKQCGFTFIQPLLS